MKMANVFGVLTFLLLAQQSLSSSHSSKLCRRNDTSCQPQLERLKLSEADCMMKYIPHDSKVCEEWTFEGSDEQQLGSVKLDAYVYTVRGYISPVFNVSMQHIKWNRLRLRFKLNNHKFTKNLCREFHLPAEIPLSELLFYDCPWADPNDANYKDKQYIFEYDASRESGGREHRTFSLLVPNYWQQENATNITDWLLFVYLDMTEFPSLTVHWTVAPSWLGGVEYDAHSFVYNVTLHYRKSACEVEEEHLVKLVEPGEELRLMHKMSSRQGEYRFGVQLSHPDCGTSGCHRAFSPIIVVEGHTPFFVKVMVVCSLLMVFMLSMAVMLMRKRSNPVEEAPPTVLIVYVPTHRAHIKVVLELAAYLRAYCRVKVLLHDTDVPRENVQELHHWFCDAYELADFIMVVSSPLQYTDLRETIYVDAGDIALKMLRLRFATPDVPPENFFCVVLPYCSKADLPREVVHSRKFFLMKDLDKMLWYLQHGPGKRARWKVYPPWCVQVAGGSVTELDRAIAGAVDTIQTYTLSAGADNPETANLLRSTTFQPYEEVDTLLETLPQSDAHAKTYSPYYPANTQDLVAIGNHHDAGVHTVMHAIDSTVKL